MPPARAASRPIAPAAMLCRMPIGRAPLRSPKKMNASSRSRMPTTSPPNRIARIILCLGTPFYPSAVRPAPFALLAAFVVVTMVPGGGSNEGFGNGRQVAARRAARGGNGRAGQPEVYQPDMGADVPRLGIPGWFLSGDRRD